MLLCPHRSAVVMVENKILQMSKKTWYKWTFYINIILFFIVALFIYLLLIDAILYGMNAGNAWIYVTRDIAFLAIALALIFFQFFRNLMLIIKRSW